MGKKKTSPRNKATGGKRSKVAETPKAAKTNGKSSPSETVQTAPELTPEMAEKISGLRSKVREQFGNVVMAMMMSGRYRYQSLSDLQHLVLDPLLRDRLGLAA